MGLVNFIGSGATDAAAQVIGFSDARQRVIADNIANIDTPGYRMRDLDIGSFNRALARAIQRSQRSGRPGGALDLPSLEQLGRDPGSGGAAADLRGIVFHDDNNRSIEELSATMVDNFNQQQRAVNILRSQIRLLRSIIAESPQTQ